MAKAKQEDLPGMENRKLKDLHDCALEYAEKRDARAEIGRAEVELKTRLLALMKKHKKQEYVFEGVSVVIVHEDEHVKVKISSTDDEEEAA